MSLENEYVLKIFVKKFSIIDYTDSNQIIIDLKFENQIIPLESSGIDFDDSCKGVCITLSETRADLLSKLKNRPLIILLKKFLSGVEVGRFSM